MHGSEILEFVRLLSKSPYRAPITGEYKEPEQLVNSNLRFDFNDT